MSVVRGEELAALHAVADAIRDEVGGCVHTVQATLDQHPAYQETEHIASEMIRRLVLYSARSCGRDVRLPLVPTFSGCDLTWAGDKVYRMYRVKKATRGRSSGDFEMLVGAASGLLKSDLQGENSVFPLEQWVFGYTVTPLRTIDEIFVAEVLGSTNSKVGHLLLGTPVMLGTTMPPDGARFPSYEDDGLPGFEDDEDDGLFGWNDIA